jgi:hypothetical protein
MKNPAAAVLQDFFNKWGWSGVFVIRLYFVYWVKIIEASRHWFLR